MRRPYRIGYRIGRLLTWPIVLILTPIIVVLELLRFGRRTWHETRRRE